MDSAPKPLLGVEQALERILTAITPVADIERIPTMAACGRTLAEGQVSNLNVPTHDNTQMDGYAVRVADCDSGHTRLAVSQRIPAGHVGTALAPGSAARIFTGGLIPPGADAVVMQEDTSAETTDQGPFVLIHARPKPGDWIRRAGEDIRSGATILQAGVRLNPQMLGLAASVGLAELPVRRRVNVAVFFTGDELAMPGQPLRPGTIYNSSRFTLRNLLQDLGCHVTDLGIVPDTLAATREALRRAADGHDCILTSGGMSVGEEDHVKPAVDAEGHLDLWQIAMKPGKPLAFGQVGRALFLGLPGNPVSSFVTFLLFVRPVVLRLEGVCDVAPMAFPMRADFDWPRPDRRQEYLRTRVNQDGGLDLFPNQGSAVLTSTVWAHGLVENPPSHPIAHGDVVRFLPFNGFSR